MFFIVKNEGAATEEEVLPLLLLQYSKLDAQDNKDWIVKCVCVGGGAVTI